MLKKTLMRLSPKNYPIKIEFVVLFSFVLNGTTFTIKNHCPFDYQYTNYHF